MKTKNILLVIFMLVVSINSNAQDTTATGEKKEKWNFLIEPYFLAPYLNGTVGIGNIPDVDIDADPDDIFSRMTFGFMLYLEAHTDKWAITMDNIYVDLKQDVSSSKINASGESTMEEYIGELAGLYKMAPWFEAGVGLRFYNFNTGLEINYTNRFTGNDTTGSRSISESWADPIFIGRIKAPFKNEDWILDLRADVGGFGIGSQLTWQAQLDFGYHFSELFQASIAYRYLYVDFEKGSGSDRFLYDIALFGPMVKIGFNF